jgi:hemerythrin
MSDKQKPAVWSDDFSIGHLGLDGEHRYFIELVNRLSLILMTHAPRQDLIDLLVLLESETEIHFRHEEDVLKLTGYPSVRDHAEAHRKLLDEIIQARLAVEKRSEIDIKAEAGRIEKLKHLMIEHILSEDKALCGHLG